MPRLPLLLPDALCNAFCVCCWKSISPEISIITGIFFSRRTLKLSRLSEGGLLLFEPAGGVLGCVVGAGAAAAAVEAAVAARASVPVSVYCGCPATAVPVTTATRSCGFETLPLDCAAVCPLPVAVTLGPMRQLSQKLCATLARRCERAWL